MTKPNPALLASHLTEQGNALAATGDFAGAELHYRDAIRICPSFPGAHTNLGNIHAQNNRLEEAAQCHRDAVALDPRFAAAYVNLGNVLVRQGQHQQAVTCLMLAGTMRPDDAEIPYNLAIALRRMGQDTAAAACYRQAIAINPAFAAAQSNLGVLLLEQGALVDAVQCHRAAVALGPHVAAFHNNLGNALRESGALDEAIACHRQAIALQPADSRLHGNLGNELQELGRFDEAWEAYEAALRCAPMTGAPYLMLAGTGRLKADSPHADRLRALAARMGSLPHQDQVELHFALARVLEDEREPAQAFAHLLAGNRLARAGIVYDEAATLAALDATSAAFPRAHVAAGGTGDAAGPLPVFIVGMPRSGTTLVEQVLAGHKAVFGAGELTTLPRLLRAFGPGQWPRLGAAYLADLRARAPAAGCVIDKLPENFRHLGIIHLALPQARIIHVRRDRFDTCMSCFAKLFAGDIPYTYDLGELGRYYDAYERLMAHWRQALPPGVMIEVEYEALVADLAGQARRLLDHCGLAWDPACLAFHLNQRPVRTASTVQVRQPLYDNAVGRWRALKEAVLF